MEVVVFCALSAHDPSFALQLGGTLFSGGVRPRKMGGPRQPRCCDKHTNKVRIEQMRQDGEEERFVESKTQRRPCSAWRPPTISVQHGGCASLHHSAGSTLARQSAEFGFCWWQCGPTVV
mmetsp:Transcript_29235/g.68002  ORF Transcript_29235/g.68002 Transcript_29235/m.68002 type:complete len:120 (+) Transcript_29235:676-1035(+)